MFDGIRMRFGKYRSYFVRSREMSRLGEKSTIRQSMEMALLFACRGLGPGHYLQSGLHERARAIPQVLDWVSEREYQNLCQRISDDRYSGLCLNKLVDKAMLSSYGFPTPELLGIFHPDHGRTTLGHELRSPLQLQNLLLERRPAGIVLKPALGCHGGGFAAIWLGYREGRVEVRTDPAQTVPSTLEAYWATRGSSSRGGLVVECLADQHPMLQLLNPSSLNTVRMFVAQRPGEPPEILFTCLKVGRPGSFTDNVSGGGLACTVNVHSGIIERARSADVLFQEYASHPDTGAKLVGLEIPMWVEATQLARDVTAFYPGHRILGLDVGFGPSFPFIVETNHRPDKVGFSLVGLPPRTMLRRFAA